MHIDDQKYTRNGKTYRRVLLRNSYRVNGKVRHDTIASLSQCTDEEIDALKLALKNKGNLSQLSVVERELKTQQGSCVGAVWLLSQIAKKLNIKKVLGNSKEAKLSLWLILATLIEQGSRLSATRLAKRHAVCDILGIEDGFNEDDLYRVMDWLEERQEKIEDHLFKLRYDTAPVFYLYDVTSSYFEGEQNELAEYGYNRDKKIGKKQIVVGLMADDDGHPIAVEVFRGNTNDTKTVNNQIKKLAKRFGVKKVTLVGDRGMIKTQQIKELNDDSVGFNWITAITKPQIEKLINDGILQLDLFDENLEEVEDNGVRYVLHRNPARVKEIADNRNSKLERLNLLVIKKNEYLKEHAKAKPSTAENEITKKITRLKIDKWVKVICIDRTLSLEIDKVKKAEDSKLDGCYAIKTDLKKDVINTEKIHARYKGLAVVENAFRTMKTSLLELRPIFVRKSNRTRTHVFIIMLAYMIEHQLRKDWRNLDVTVEEGISELSSICSIEVNANNTVNYQTIPAPRTLGAQLLKASCVTLPKAIPSVNAIVDTRKKLTSERKSQQ